jgi:uncharacterized membrane protein
MSFQRPPKDNLYKFIAITGLILLVIAIILPFYARDRFVFIMDQELDEAREFLSKTKQTDNLVEAEKKRLEFIQKYLLENTRYAEKASYVLFIVSFLLIFIGLYFWYFELQRYQDEILKKQAESSKPDEPTP